MRCLSCEDSERRDAANAADLAHERKEVELLAEALRERNERIAELERASDMWSRMEAEQRALREITEAEIKRLRGAILDLYQTSDGAPDGPEDWLEPRVDRKAWESFCDLAREIAWEKP